MNKFNYSKFTQTLLYFPTNSMNNYEIVITQAFVSFKAFPNYFVAVHSRVVTTIHCEIGVWVYLSESFEDYENCN